MTAAPTPLIEKLGGAAHSKQSLRLWLRLLSCAMVIEKRIRQKLVDEFDATLPRFDVLAALDRRPEGLTMGELSSMLLVSNGNVTQIIGRLIDDGLVERVAYPSDRRINRVRTTPAGQEAFSAMAAQHEHWIDHMMADLDDREVASMLADLDRLRHSIERNPI